MNTNPFFAHETAILDENISIGNGTKIWHFSHIQSGAVIGENCSLGQNVNVGNNVKIGGNSGVIKDIPDNKKVMGYPSMDFKKFVKNWRSNGQ